MKKKIKSISLTMLILSMLISLFVPNTTILAATYSDSHQYSHLVYDGGESGYLEEITDFSSIPNPKARLFANAKPVYSVSGNLVAYVTLYYNTTTSGGRTVFVYDSQFVLDNNPQNGYTGAITILSVTPDWVKIKYEFANMIGDSGYRELVFYP